MKIEETKPTTREFTLTVTEDELAVIEHALYKDTPEAQRGSAKSFDVWDKIDDAVNAAGIKKIRLSGDQ